MAGDLGIANTRSPSGEPLTDGVQPGVPDQDWLDGLATDDDDERRRLLRELVLRALV
jgi:hypothetical protein